MLLILALCISKTKMTLQITTGICKHELNKIYQITFSLDYLDVFLLGYIYILTTL